jgi:hypothetical protein
MTTFFLLIWFTIVMQQAQIAECPGVTIVQNGLAAFEAGTPQIAHYTNPDDYLRDGIRYIYDRCGAETPIPLDWMN